MPTEHESRTKADFNESFVTAHLPDLKKRWDAALAACKTADDSYLDDGSLSILSLTFSWHAGTVHEDYRLDVTLNEPFAEAEVFNLNEDTSEAVGDLYANCKHGLWWEANSWPAPCECDEYCGEHDRSFCGECFPDTFGAEEE